MKGRVKPFLLLVLLTLGSISSSFSQKKSEMLDSLRNLTETGNPDTVRLKNLIQLARTVHPDTGLAYLNEAMNIIEQRGKDEWRPEVWMTKGRLLRNKGDITGAKGEYRRALDFYEKNGSRMEQGKARKGLGLVFFYGNDLNRALEELEKSAELFGEAGNKGAQASALGNMGIIYQNMGEYEKSAELYDKVEKIFQEMGNDQGLLAVHLNKGIIYHELANYPQALRNYLSSKKYAEKLGDKRRLGSSLHNIGLVYLDMKEYDKAAKNLKKSLAINKETGDRKGTGKLYLNLGVLYEGYGKIDSALNYYQRSIEVRKELGDELGLAECYNNIGNLYQVPVNLGRDSVSATYPDRILELSNEALLDSSLEYQQKALDLSRSSTEYLLLNHIYHSLGESYFIKGESVKGEKYMEKAVDIAKKLGNKREAYHSLNSIAEIHASIGEHSKAYKEQKEAYDLREEVFNENKSKKIGRMETKFKYEKKMLRKKKEREKEIAIQKEKEERKDLVILGVSSGLGLVLLFSIFLFNRFRVTKKQKGVIEDQKKKVDEAYGELHEKNKEITDSIHYASRIQSAILTANDYMEKHLGDHFVLFKPKEAVSGDFYWAYGDEGHAIWVAADCTGHGVPGAFMSMIGNRLFNEVVVEQAERDPGRVLDKVRQGIIQALGQSGDEDAKDGMDAAICVLDRSKGVLNFAGANNPLYVIRKGQGNESLSGLEMVKGGQLLPSYDDRIKSMTSDDGSTGLIELKGDKQPIGQPEGEAEHFTTISFQLKSGDSLYTFSDGFADQFGGEKGKKYRYKPFKKLLISLNDKPMNEQLNALEKEFDEWKGSREQIDDVVVVGVNGFV